LELSEMFAWGEFLPQPGFRPSVQQWPYCQSQTTNFHMGEYMYRHILTGLALVFAISALGNTPAKACDWDYCDGCGGYGYYSGAAYGYYAPQAYGYGAANYYAPAAYPYAPPPYYAAPAYYAAPVYYVAPAYSAPYARPYFYGWRGGYVDARNRPKEYAPALNPGGRGVYAAAASHARRANIAPIPTYGARQTISANYGKQGNDADLAASAGRGAHAAAAYRDQNASKTTFPARSSRPIFVAGANNANQGSSFATGGNGRRVGYVATGSGGEPRDLAALETTLPPRNERPRRAHNGSVQAGRAVIERAGFGMAFLPSPPVPPNSVSVRTAARNRY